MARVVSAEGEEAIRAVQIAARYGERHRKAKTHVRPSGALAELVDGEEEALFRIVSLVRNLEGSVPVARVAGTKITKRDLRAAAFANDLCDLVTKNSKATLRAIAVSDLADAHDLDPGLEAFGALMSGLTPEAIRNADGPRKAVRKAVGRMMGRGGEARGEVVIANAQKILQGGGIASALHFRRWSEEKTLKYVKTIVGD